MSSSSWSDLPIDILIIIKKKLSDLISFRSVCSQWRSVVPTPTILPYYRADFDNKDNIIHFTKRYEGSYNDLFLSFPYPHFSISPISLFCTSNGWLAFKNPNNETLHIFDPVSKHKFIFPPLYPELLCHYKNLKPSIIDAFRLNLTKVVVSTRAGVAVAGIVEIFNRTNLQFPDRRFVFCRYGRGKKWSILMERSRGIKDIAVAGDGRFYAVGKDWEFYMLDERVTFMRLKRFKLWLPKKVLEAKPDREKYPEAKCVSIISCSTEINVRIYGSFSICLIINVAKLCGRGKNVDVACDVEWGCYDPSPFPCVYFFIPSLRNGIDHSRKKKKRSKLKNNNNKGGILKLFH